MPPRTAHLTPGEPRTMARATARAVQHEVFTACTFQAAPFATAPQDELAADAARGLTRAASARAHRSRTTRDMQQPSAAGRAALSRRNAGVHGRRYGRLEARA